MRKELVVENIVRFLLNGAIVVFLLGFLLGLLWYGNGSLEMVPTEEQQEKAKGAAVVLMFMTGVPCLACTAARLRHRKAEWKPGEKPGL